MSFQSLCRTVVMALTAITVVALFVYALGYALFAPSPDPEYLRVLQTGQFTIGHARIITNRQAPVLYRFEADGKSYKDNWGAVLNERVAGRRWLGFLLEPGKQQDFLVIYNPADPEHWNVLRCDCPINDSVDFRYYVQRFEKLRQEGRIELRKLLTEMISGK